jgi:hypothetical protein
MRVRNDFDFWLAAGLLVVSVVGITAGCTDIGPVDENYVNHRPWNEDPYAIGPDAHWMDRKLMGSAEAVRQQEWKDQNPPRDMGDYLFRN